jgi:phage baseplate assembly protein W
MARIIPSNGVGNRPPNLNVGVGIGLPFNGPAGGFNTTFNSNEQSRYNFINYLLTNHGERPLNPNFGANLRSFVFEQTEGDLMDSLDRAIRNAAESFFPRVLIRDIQILSGRDNNQVIITITFSIRSTNITDTINLELNGQDI